MASARRLIATADDVGLHRLMNEGAIRAHREGIINACSVVANGREFDHAVALLKKYPGLEPGVHLTFVEEKPLTSGFTSFPENWRAFVRAWTLRRIDAGKLESELRAQIEKVSAAGLRPTHLNSHQHLHALPGIAKIVKRLQSEYGIGYLRVPRDRGGLRRRTAMTLLAVLARNLGDRSTIGIADAGHLTLGRLLELLEHVSGVTELVTHPGLGGEIPYDWGYNWEVETAALCEPALREALRAQGITLVRPSEV
jgi:predicted glycoside hydrolase/deacetylase ChbG (UPF0249 family)